MVTSRNSNQLGSKSRQNSCQVQPPEDIGNLSASRPRLSVRTTASTGSTQSVEAVVVIVPKDMVVTSISFRCPRVIGPGKDFVAIWIPVGLSSDLSSRCDPLTFVPLRDHVQYSAGLATAYITGYGRGPIG